MFFSDLSSDPKETTNIISYININVGPKKKTRRKPSNQTTQNDQLALQSAFPGHRPPRVPESSSLWFSARSGRSGTSEDADRVFPVSFLGFPQMRCLTSQFFGETSGENLISGFWEPPNEVFNFPVFWGEPLVRIRKNWLPKLLPSGRRRRHVIADLSTRSISVLMKQQIDRPSERLNQMHRVSWGTTVLLIGMCCCSTNLEKWWNQSSPGALIKMLQGV